MPIFTLTKSRMTTMMSSLKKIVEYGDGAYMYSDYIIPKHETLARSIIQSPLPVIFSDTIMVVDSEFVDLWSKISKETGLSNITLDYESAEINDCNDVVYLRYTKDGKENIVLVAHGIKDEIDVPFIAGAFGIYNNFHEVVILKCEDMTPLSSEQLNKVRLSEVVILEKNGFTVRISRDNIPLTGPLRKDGPVPFKATFNIVHIEREDTDDDYRLILYVNYKDLEAIHIYSFIPF